MNPVSWLAVFKFVVDLFDDIVNDDSTDPKNHKECEHFVEDSKNEAVVNKAIERVKEKHPDIGLIVSNVADAVTLINKVVAEKA